VRRGISRIHRLVAASLPRGDLSQAKISALASLQREGSTNAGTLSGRMTIRPQSLTRVLADLERDGLVTRTRAVEDGR
jgi:DNA-binding MarR family transcriptional regulator